VEQVYNEYRSATIPATDILTMNKRTLDVLFQAFQPSIVHLIPVDSLETEETTSYRLKKSEINYEDNFIQRQKEYQIILEKKPPMEIDFSESIEDTPIQNINDLIEKHVKERELLFNQEQDISFNKQPEKKTVSWNENI
jgi:hypothetical protein